jgi:hypothetical protein
MSRSSSRTTLAPDTREVVDHGQDTEAPSIGQAVAHEIQRPALIGTLRQRHRRPGAQRSLAAAAPAHLQPLLAIEPAQLLVVHRYPLPPQQNLQAAIAEPAAGGRQFP